MHRRAALSGTPDLAARVWDRVVCDHAGMDGHLADAIADGYERWSASGDRSVMALFSTDFDDNVSGRRGLGIFDVVERWLQESFANRWVEHHATMFDGDRVMVWYTAHGRHVGDGFPRLAGCAVTGAEVAWPQVHMFRVEDGLVVEHWAVRDDFGMLEQIRHAQPDIRTTGAGRSTVRQACCDDGSMSMQEWWPRLAQETRDWLIEHNGEALPASVVEEIARVGGSITSDAWWVGESGPTGFYLSDAAVDWVEEVANGENPAAPD